jgi:hypothetical protein
MPKKIVVFLFILLILILAIGIYWQKLPEEKPSKKDEITEKGPFGQPPKKDSSVFSFTHVRPDGNRLSFGNGSLPDYKTLDIKLSGKPIWVTAASINESSIWVAVLGDGNVQAFRIINNSYIEIEIEPDKLPPGMPPLLSLNNITTQLITENNGSKLTHPVMLNETNRIAFITPDGDLIISNETSELRLEINALPDARLLLDDKDRILLLTGPTNRYSHGVLGDSLEASQITLVETSGTPSVILNITLEEDKVIEGISPIWADLNGDGDFEIIVTVSDSENGAQIRAYNEDGNLIAEGLAIGQGYRWRHQIAVAPFGPNGELELVDVKTPHIGGVVEFYRMIGSELKIVSSISGYTSHRIGSRNLDMAVAGDFDSDGNFELLVPNQARTKLGGIRHTENSAEEVWSLDIDGKINTNVGVTTTIDGTIIIGVGREDSVLRLWLPD